MRLEAGSWSEREPAEPTRARCGYLCRCLILFMDNLQITLCVCPRLHPIRTPWNTVVRHPSKTFISNRNSRLIAITIDPNRLGHSYSTLTRVLTVWLELGYWIFEVWWCLVHLLAHTATFVIVSPQSCPTLYKIHRFTSTMGDSGFKGTAIDQDTRFADKEAKLLRTTKFPPSFATKVDMRKVNATVMRSWMAKEVTILLGFEDEVVIEYAVSKRAQSLVVRMYPYAYQANPIPCMPRSSRYDPLR